MEDEVASEHKRSSDIYRGLQLTRPDAIRVLDLLPGKCDDELRITLQVAFLNSEPKYEALSYTWGASTEDRFVRVNCDGQLGVTDNLFRALRGLRRRFRTRTMWIDAICIDQSSFEEKNNQVQMMGRIYQQGCCTNVWLGEPNDAIIPSKTAFADLKEISTQNLWKSPRALLGHLRQDVAMINDAIESSNPRWHERSWTIQEFVFSRRVFLCFGGRRIVFQPDVIEKLTETAYRPGFRGFAQVLSGRLSPARQARLSGTKISMATVIQLIRNSSTQDPRDRVYSLRNLITPEEANAIEVDYSMPSWKVYAKATFASLATSNSCDILQYVTIVGRNTEELPTWTVDFTSLPSSEYHLDALIIGGLSRGAYSMQDMYARPPDIAARRPHVSLDAPCRYLSIEGIGIDKIARVVPVDDSSREAYMSQMEEVDSLIQQAVIAIAMTVLKRPDGSENNDPHAVLARGVVLSASTDEVEADDKAKLFNDGRPSIGSMVPYYAFYEWDRAFRIHPTPERAGAFESYLALFIFLRYTREVGGGHALFGTKTGLIGTGPSSLGEEDVLVLVRSRWPFIVLRPSGQRFTFRGLAYVHGLMDRRFWDNDEGLLKEETFVLD